MKNILMKNIQCQIRVGATGALLGVICLATEGRGQPLPAASSTMSVSVPNSGLNQSTPGTLSTSYTATGYEVGSASATASLIQGFDPSVTASVSFSDASADASAIYDYYFEILGGGGSTVTVPIIVSANGGVTSSGSGGSVTSSLVLSQQTTGSLGPIFGIKFQSVAELVRNIASGPTSFADDQTVDLTANTLDLVGMSVTVSSYALAGSAGGYVDPQISIDPTFLADNPGYSIVYSPNFLPASVPDSASTLELLGLGVAGTALVRRKLFEVGVTH